MKIIHALYPHYDPKIIGQNLKNEQKNIHVCTHEIIASNHHENENENGKTDHVAIRQNRPKLRHGHK